MNHSVVHLKLTYQLYLSKNKREIHMNFFLIYYKYPYVNCEVSNGR